MATRRENTPEASVYRLALYHCFLGEMLRTGEVGHVTSKRLSAELGVKEETIRRDMSFIGGVGRPGAGYESHALFDAIAEFLGLSDEYPIVKVGSAQMISALEVVFPAPNYGVRPVGYFSELPDDVGTRINDIEVKHITDIASVVPGLGVSVALVACSPGWIQMTLDLLHEAGVTGVLLLTPAIKLTKPEGMQLTHIRMPCDIKSLACRCQVPVARP